jgi:hypothetical protein
MVRWRFSDYEAARIALVRVRLERAAHHWRRGCPLGRYLHSVSRPTAFRSLLECAETRSIQAQWLQLRSQPAIAEQRPSAAGAGVHDGLFAGIQTQRSVRSDHRTINIVLINNHRDPDL